MNKRSENKNESSSSSTIMRRLKAPLVIFALLADARISLWYKFLFFAAFLWVVLPDLIPGGIDDLVLSFLGPTVFAEVCKDTYPHVYREHYDKVFPVEAAQQKQKAGRDNN